MAIRPISSKTRWNSPSLWWGFAEIELAWIRMTSRDSRFLYFLKVFWGRTGVWRGWSRRPPGRRLFRWHWSLTFDRCPEGSNEQCWLNIAKNKPRWGSRWYWCTQPSMSTSRWLSARCWWCWWRQWTRRWEELFPVFIFKQDFIDIQRLSFENIWQVEWLVELQVEVLSVELVELWSRQVVPSSVFGFQILMLAGRGGLQDRWGLDHQVLHLYPQTTSIVIIYLVVIPVWVVFFYNSLGTSFNNFLAFCDKRVDLVEVVELISCTWAGGVYWLCIARTLLSMSLLVIV